MRRRFKIAFVILMVVTIIALICAIGLVWGDIQKLNAELDRLHWIEENTHSGGVRIAIEVAEAKLHEQLTILAVLSVVAVITIVSSILMKHKSTSRTAMRKEVFGGGK